MYSCEADDECMENIKDGGVRIETPTTKFSYALQYLSHNVSHHHRAIFLTHEGQTEVGIELTS